jgi:hypothetical protein
VEQFDQFDQTLAGLRILDLAYQVVPRPLLVEGEHLLAGPLALDGLQTGATSDHYSHIGYMAQGQVSTVLAQVEEEGVADVGHNGPCH